MSKIYKSLTDLIGNTPLLELSNYEKENNLEAKILVKLEYFNPAGSVKDRIAKKILDDAEAKGLINKDTTIIEPTSGNTGIGLSAVAAARGYKIIITMPETMSVERRLLMAAYGAKLVLTDGAKGMKGAIAKANELHEHTPNSFIPGQFVNPANPQAHFETTGPEIWNDTDGKVDIFVAGVGTGGTLSGTGKFLKSKNPDVKVVAVEPATSPVLSEGKSGPHKIQVSARALYLIRSTPRFMTKLSRLKTTTHSLTAVQLQNPTEFLWVFLRVLPLRLPPISHAVPKTMVRQ